MDELIFTDQNFESEVLKSAVPVLIDFWAPWCGPCRIASPIVERFAASMQGKPVKVGKLNVDDNSATAQRYHIMSIPTFLVFKGGQVVEQIVGVPTEASLKAKLEPHLS